MNNTTTNQAPRSQKGAALVKNSRLMTHILGSQYDVYQLVATLLVFKESLRQLTHKHQCSFQQCTGKEFEPIRDFHTPTENPFYELSRSLGSLGLLTCTLGFFEKFKFVNEELLIDVTNMLATMLHIENVLAGFDEHNGELDMQTINQASVLDVAGATGQLIFWVTHHQHSNKKTLKNEVVSYTDQMAKRYGDREALSALVTDYALLLINMLDYYEHMQNQRETVAVYDQNKKGVHLGDVAVPHYGIHANRSHAATKRNVTLYSFIEVPKGQEYTYCLGLGHAFTSRCDCDTSRCDCVERAAYVEQVGAGLVLMHLHYPTRPLRIC